MAVDTISQRSRRALLTGGLGAVVATVASAIGRPLAARATDGDIVHVGDFNITGNTQETRIGSTSHIAFTGESTNATGWGLFGAGGGGGVVGWGMNNGCGVTGMSQSVLGFLYGPIAKTGVYGVAHQDATSRGVLGRSTAGVGVQGEAVEDAGNHPGIWGTGVIGLSGPGTGAVLSKTGVYGYAAQDGSARGVTGETTAGRGVNGIATSGTGVQGATNTGIGVQAISSGSGQAFKAQGRVSFSTSGLALVAVGAKIKTITPGSDLAATSLVLCTLESNQSGLAIQRVTKDTTLNTFKVYLSVAVASGKSAKVAWFVIG